MLDRCAAIYDQIGEVLSRELPAGWTQAWAYSEMSERDGSVVVYCAYASGRVAWIDPPLPLYERFRELNNAARNADPTAVWTTATFIVAADGKFSVDFGYGPISIDEELERDAAWKAKYLPASV